MDAEGALTVMRVLYCMCVQCDSVMVTAMLGDGGGVSIWVVHVVQVLCLLPTTC